MNATTLTRLTPEECAANSNRICGVNIDARVLPAYHERCKNPVAWLCRNDGGHTIPSGISTLQEYYLCDEHAKQVKL